MNKWFDENGTDVDANPNEAFKGGVYNHMTNYNSKLKDVNFGLNSYCGPSVLSALTGKTTDECASVISAINGSREIKAVNMKDLIAALNKLRFDAVVVKTISYSLYGNLSALASKPGLYVITVPRHVIAIEVTEDNQIFLIDNASKQVIDAASSARLSQRVDDIYKIVEKPSPVFVRTEVEIKRSRDNISMKMIDVHEDSADNIGFNAGFIYYRSVKDLAALQIKLNEIIEQIRWEYK